MKIPLTVDGHDVVMQLDNDTVTVRELVTVASGADVDAATALVGGRPVALDFPVALSALRPGAAINATRRGPTSFEPASWAVHVIAGVDAGRTVSFPAPLDAQSSRFELRVGRSAAADVRLTSSAVSKHHCTIAVEAGVITVADADSRNGTVVRGRRLGTEWSNIEVGEPIRCGPAVLMVRAVPLPDPPRAVAELLAGAPSGPVPFYRSPVDLASKSATLGGEQRRRQELLAAAGNLGNVRDYRAARRAGMLAPELATEPLPELLVIVDEFAELLDQEPAFIDFFLTIGRVGRSLGIHLLLASQRLA